MTTEIAQLTPVHSASMSLKQVTDRVNLVHEVLKKVMKNGTHFGTVPGCGSKMVLLKPGADVLAMTFRLVPQFAVTRNDLEDGHREYDVTCSMYGPDGALLGQGVGSASTMEKKYRYRKGDGGGKIENEDIADVYNTVLKIAKKRAHIDATLTVTGAADLFTQDLIDEEDAEQKKPVTMPTGKTEHVKPEGDIARGLVGQVSEKKLPSGKTKYGVLVDGKWYGTFSSTDAGVARDAKMQGKPVALAWLRNGDFYNVASINVEDAAPLTDAEKAEIEAREKKAADGELL